MADIKVISIDKIKELREEVENKYDDLVNSWDEKGQGKNEMIEEVLEIIDRLIEKEQEEFNPELFALNQTKANKD